MIVLNIQDVNKILPTNKTSIQIWTIHGINFQCTPVLFLFQRLYFGDVSYIQATKIILESLGALDYAFVCLNTPELSTSKYVSFKVILEGTLSFPMILPLDQKYFWNSFAGTVCRDCRTLSRTFPTDIQIFALLSVNLISEYS